LANSLLPIEEKDSLLSIGTEFVRVLGVELYPVLVLELLGVLELKGHDWALLLLVCPIPQGDSLRLIVTESHQVFVIH